MKKHIWVMALVISALFVGVVAADGPRSAQDQAFLSQLAKQLKAPQAQAPVSASAFTDDPVSFPSGPALCNQVSCRSAFDCRIACPGGGYCDSFSKHCNYI